MHEDFSLALLLLFWVWGNGGWEFQVMGGALVFADIS